MAKLKLILIALIITTLLSSMCTSSPNEKREIMSNKKVLMVIAPKDFRDEELFEPMAVFEANGLKVDVVSTKKGTCIGMLGNKITVNKTINEVNPNEYVAIVIPGGIGSKEYLWNNTELLSLVKKFYEDHKVVAAICLSPVVLARAGILKGKKATVFPDPEAIEELKKYGAIYEDKGVVVDGNIITAQSPNYARVFGLEVLKVIENNSK
ncbi:intracellular protease, PfpI family [Methanocaldococcus vulcanius M7]|uniref:Intracellular protease, PfpI family n=1 Tax=Methanocaldococcus vulcanius (strain ATCC 700851 / DSM 12094 / M7) TaxID=579137 RepID=C9RGD3_METVM|nr:DJ-1/PfpI/YhbO family deglycase/protease [Methanocaldococcus vulcanius]ACX72635.1 intracellular protease, PfpI family [Methanocaldococcus vulcanius M7]